MQNTTDKYTLGILGGMGPLSTAYFFDELVRRTVAHSDQEHINTIILNHATLPDRTAVLKSGDKQLFLDKIRNDLRILGNENVSHIALTCNTAHSFFDDLQAMTNVKILHMPKITVERIKQNQNIKKVGILGTTGTVNSRLYHNELNSQGLEPITPDEEYQNLVMEIIYKDIKGNGILPIEKLVKCIKHLEKKGADTVILGCTELSLMKNFYEVKYTCIDALDSLIRECIKLSGKTYQEIPYDYSLKTFLKKLIRILSLKIRLMMTKSKTT